jgi:hypothetical protein
MPGGIFQQYPRSKARQVQATRQDAGAVVCPNRGSGSRWVAGCLRCARYLWSEISERASEPDWVIHPDKRRHHCLPLVRRRSSCSKNVLGCKGWQCDYEGPPRNPAVSWFGLRSFIEDRSRTLRSYCRGGASFSQCGPNTQCRSVVRVVTLRSNLWPSSDCLKPSDNAL